MTFPARTDNLDGDKRDRMFRGQEGHQNLGFDLEMFRMQGQAGPGFQVDQAIAALSVGQMFSQLDVTIGGSSSGSLGGAARGLTTRPPHAIAHPPAPRRVCPRPIEERRQLIRRVLAVPVESHRPFMA